MAKDNNKLTRVDIKEVFRSKNPRLAGILPWFVYSYLKRIIHEDFINYFLKKHSSKIGLEFLIASIEEFNVSIDVKGRENIPKKGKYIFAANHPLGGFDGIILMYILNQNNLSFKFLVNDILLNIINLKEFFIPLNKHGSHTKDTISKIDEAFKSEDQILTFPAGYVSRRIKGEIIDLEWKKNFITKSVQFKRDIIPVHFSGRNTNFFYNLSNIRKFFGIKTNLEMLFLPDETYRHRNKKIAVYFGQPIPYTTFDNRFTYYEFAQMIKGHVYSLINNVNNPFVV